LSASRRRKTFDEAYYERFYRNQETRVTDAETMERLGGFVCAYLRHLEVDVRTVVDLGCGLGPWKRIIARHFPGAAYTGVEVSEYLCKQYGWKQGSVVDYRARGRVDVVICQGVLQYLSESDARAAIRNLASLCDGALFLEVLTQEDWDHNCDREATDGDCYLRPAAWYAARLRQHFLNCGGGVYLTKKHEHFVYALDRLG